MMDLQSKNRAFTLVELLTVMAIITMLIGLLIPSLNTVRRFAKNTKQSAQLASIGAALTTFHNDYGEYPPSDRFSDNTNQDDYCGTQKLCEAMLGRDLMGFHPETSWSATDERYYRIVTVEQRQRVGRYLELATANAFRLGISPGAQDGLFDFGAPVFSGLHLAGNTFVLCDVFANTRIVMTNGDTVRAGRPILYYRANASSRVLDGGAALQDRIYNHMDNIDLIAVQDISDDGNFGDHPLSGGVPRGTQFYTYITDPRVPNEWPYRPDSYLLITAGADGLYGSGDDICNFGN